MKKIFLSLILVVSILFSTKITFAEIASLDNIGGGEANSSAASVINQNGQGVNTDIKATTIIGGAIKIVLGLGGTVSLIYIVWSGWGWMMAKGDKTKILVIRKRLAAALAGLVLIAGSYAITDFVIDQIIVTAGDINAGESDNSNNNGNNSNTPSCYTHEQSMSYIDASSSCNADSLCKWICTDNTLSDFSGCCDIK